MLQTDGYAGYQHVCRDNPITSTWCWYQVRREFVDERTAAPSKKKGQQLGKEDLAIGKIYELQGIEQRIEDLAPIDKTAQRQQPSLKVVWRLRSGDPCLLAKEHVRVGPFQQRLWILPVFGAKRKADRGARREGITRSSSREVYPAELNLTQTQLIEPADQILGTQMGVAAQHLHGLAAGDRGDLLVAETGLDQTRDRLVAQVMKT